MVRIIFVNFMSLATFVSFILTLIMREYIPSDLNMTDSWQSVYTSNLLNDHIFLIAIVAHVRAETSADRPFPTSGTQACTIDCLRMGIHGG